MNRPLTLAEYQKWADDHFVRYASHSVTRQDLRILLLLEVSLSGAVRVIFGNRTVYLGDDVEEAINTFNSILLTVYLKGEAYNE